VSKSHRIEQRSIPLLYSENESRDVVVVL